jgi:acyl-coenzyme A thioesterase PaaI-like protein
MVLTVTKPGGLPKKFFLFLTERVSPFIRNKNVKITKMTNNQFTVSLPYKSSFCGRLLTSFNTEPKVSKKEFNYHTGVLATMIDHAGGFGAWSFLSDPDLRISTANLRIDYLY